ncbi:unnamed protein product [Callosobruchus maculatus]|nr:unnamed protein product [Callosobruchus maculatus]
MDGTFKESESASDSNKCSADRDEGAAAFMEESHTDDEEDVRLNLDCSKSDDEDDLGESDHHEASDNEHNTEGDLIGAQNSTDESHINTSKDKVLVDSDKNHTDDKEEIQSADNQTSGIVEEEASENTDKDHAADKQQEDNGPAKSDDEPDGNKAKTTAEVEDVGTETVDGQNEDVTEKSKSEEETQHKDGKGEAEVETKGDQNSKEVDKPNEKLLKDLENHTDDKDNGESSGNQTKDESEKDTKKGTDGSHDGVEQDVPSNSVDDPHKSDHDASKDDKTKTVPEVEDNTGSKESSQNKENEEKSKNEEEAPKTDGEKEAESKDQSEKNDDKGDKYSLLKETLSKPNDEAKEQENNEEEMDEDFDPSDFDPSLLCPEVAMEVDEAPVISPANDSQNDDGAKSPILFDAVFSTYVDEMTGTETCFDLTPEEDKLRQETYGQKNPVQYTKIHCTACNVHLGSALDGQGNRFVHPLLKVLICKNCYYFYSSGEFERDEDGSELYCRWCGQGGQVMCCSKCEMVFCKKCIRINFDRKKIADIRDSDDWLCFRCNPSQITHLKIHCAEFMEYVRRERSRAVTLENYSAFTNADHALCCQSMKKKATDTPPEQPKRKRRRAAPVDPDYNPLKDEEDDNDVIEKVPHTIAPTPAAKAPSTPPAVAPRANGVPSRPLVQQVRPGMTSVRPRTPSSSLGPDCSLLVRFLCRRKDLELHLLQVTSRFYPVA